MNRQLRLMSFSLRQFLTVPYFLQLLLLSTFGATALQALAAGAWPVDATLAWTRAGIIGTWNMCIVAAGILNFERYRGTFVYLLNGAVNPLRRSQRWSQLPPFLGLPPCHWPGLSGRCAPSR